MRLLGLDYAGWRHTWELARERATGGYPTELREHGPGPTFRDYLVQMTGAGWPMSGRPPC